MGVLTKLKESEYSKLVIVTHIADYTACSTRATIGESQVVILTSSALLKTLRTHHTYRDLINI